MIKKIFILPVMSLISAPLIAESSFQPGNILVMSENVIYEFATDSQLISQTLIPQNTAGEVARDFTILTNGNLAVFNGTFSPELTIYDGANWTSFTEAGWSLPNNGSYGGIASIGDVVYVTDGFTYSGGEAKGIISFDTNSNVNQRTFNQNEYIDITLGGDDLMYALRDVYGDLDVIDSNTMTLVRTVDLGHTSNSRGAIANGNGDIYMVSWDGYIARYDSLGVLIDTLSIGGNLQDININTTGQILVGSRFGSAYIINEDFSSYSEVVVGTGNTFVSFVPEPQSLAAPELSGNHQRKGSWIKTTLNWTTEAQAVDVYLNGKLIDTVSGINTAVYSYSRKITQIFTVCNAGTSDCSIDYFAN